MKQPAYDMQAIFITDFKKTQKGTCIFVEFAV